MFLLLHHHHHHHHQYQQVCVVIPDSDLTRGSVSENIQMFPLLCLLHWSCVCGLDRNYLAAGLEKYFHCVMRVSGELGEQGEQV